MPTNFKPILLGSVFVAAVVAALVMEPIPQDPAYHQFADQRAYFGIPHFWNVVSNLPLALAGALGMAGVAGRHGSGYLKPLRPLYLAFFGGALLTGIGSGYYHLDPTHWSLTWDRLPMALMFMAFFSVIWGEHLSTKRARQLIWPLIALGLASVIYWIATESKGQGDLRAYALIQFLPLVLMVLILMLYPSKLDKVHYLWGILALYLAAKVAELLDGPIYIFSGVLSGHTVKHLIAAAGVYLFCLALRRRNIRSSENHA